MLLASIFQGFSASCHLAAAILTLCVFPSTVLGFSLEDVGCDGSVKHHALLPTAVLILTGLYISRCASQWYNPALLSVVLLSLGSRAANLCWMHLHVFPKDRQSV